MKKEICKVLKNNGLSCVIEANSEIVDFLDVTFDLTSGVYKPFKKENETPMYVHSGSNHPPTVLKNIPLGFNQRLTRISSNKQVFDAAARDYQEALVKSGYSHKLEYNPIERGQKKKNRERNIMWFNPPYSANVRTNLGRDFLKLIDTVFPPSHPLHKLFNRKTVKVSYKCMPSMAQAVAQHNVQILKEDPQIIVQQPGCNCRGGPDTCPV